MCLNCLFVYCHNQPSDLFLCLSSFNTAAGQALEITRSCGIMSEFSRIVVRLFQWMGRISATTSPTERGTDIASISYQLLGRLRKLAALFCGCSCTLPTEHISTRR